MPRSWKLLSFMCVLVIAGCGGSPAAHKSTKQQGAPQPQTEKTVLLRTTQRPPDVSEQFDYVGGAGPGACHFEPSADQPRIEFFAQPFSSVPESAQDTNAHSAQATFGQGVDLCFHDFGQGPVDVEVRRPDGTTTSGVLPRLALRDKYDTGWAPYDWLPDLDPSWPLGRYVVSASAGSLQASSSFVLVARNEAGLRVVGPSTDPGHNDVARDSYAKVFLTGFKGIKSVRMVIYKAQGSTGGTYFSSVLVQLPPSGNTFVRLATGHASPAPTFILTARHGAQQLSSAFTVTGPFATKSTIVGQLAPP